MRSDRPRYLETSGAERSLRWAFGSGVSLRAYEVIDQTRPWFCVSARRAELVFVVEGELSLEMGPARQHLRLGPSSAVIILRGTPHNIHSAPGTKTLVIDVSEQALDAIKVPRSLGLVGVNREAFRGGRDDRCGRLYETISTLPCDEIREQLSSVFLRSLPTTFHAFEPCHSTHKMLDVKTRLDETYMETIDLNDLAQEASVDRFYLLRSFKRNFGAPPLTYVHHIRLDSFVRSVLQESDRPLIELAGKSGFGDYSTFSRRVRQRLGKAPSQLVLR